MIKQIPDQRPSIHQLHSGRNVETLLCGHGASFVVDKRHEAQTTDEMNDDTTWTEKGSKGPKIEPQPRPTPERDEPESRAPRCLRPVLPLPHIYVRIRCMSEFGRYRRFVNLLKNYHLEGDRSTNCAVSK